MKKNRYTREVQLNKKISATHNFVYEFDPFDNSTTNSNKVSTSKKGGNVYGQSKGKIVESVSDKEKLYCGTTHQCRLTRSKSHANHNFTPNIGMREQNKGHASESKRQNKSLNTEIDREVRKVKSDWQALRMERGWTYDKNYVTRAPTKAMYGTLAKVTEKIDNMQKTEFNSLTNNYLRKSVLKNFENSTTMTLEKEAEKIRNTLFPKDECNRKIENDQLPRNIYSEKISIPKSIISEAPNINNVGQTKSTMRSLLSMIKKEQINSSLISDNTTTANLEKEIQNKSKIKLESDRMDDRKVEKDIRKDVQNYLDKYINNIERSLEKETRKEVVLTEPTSHDVIEMLNEAGVEPTEFNSIPENLDLNFDQYLFDENQTVENMPHKINVEKNPSLFNSIDKSIGKLSSDNSVQTMYKQISEKDTFLKMGLSADMQEDTISRILQSEYLKKDLRSALRPM